MDGIRIRCLTNIKGLDLPSILQLLGDRALTSTWRCEVGETLISGALWNHVANLDGPYRPGRDLAGEALLTVAEQAVLVDSGEFMAYEPGSTDPWLILVFYDSSYWEVLSNDSNVIGEFKKRYPWFKPIRGDERTSIWRRT